MDVIIKRLNLWIISYLFFLPPLGVSFPVRCLMPSFFSSWSYCCVPPTPSTVEHYCVHPSSQLIYIQMLIIGNIFSPRNVYVGGTWHCSSDGRLWSQVALGFHPSSVTFSFIAQWPLFEQVTLPLEVLDSSAIIWD